MYLTFPVTPWNGASRIRVAETRSIILRNLKSPFGKALLKRMLYVAAADALLRLPDKEGQLTIDDGGVVWRATPGPGRAARR